MGTVMEEAGAWTSFGEQPTTDPDWMTGPSTEHMAAIAENLARSLAADHEVGTEVNGRWISLISDHKKGVAEIAAITALGLSVGGVFLATRKLRVRQKK